MGTITHLFGDGFSIHGGAKNTGLDIQRFSVSPEQIHPKETLP